MSDSNLNDRVERLEIDMNDVKAALNQLIEYAVQSDRRLTSVVDRLAQVQTQTLPIIEGMQTDIRDIRVEMREMQSQIQGMQVEQGRVLDYLFNVSSTGEIRCVGDSGTPPKSPILGDFEQGEKSLALQSPTRGGFRGKTPGYCSLKGFVELTFI